MACTLHRMRLFVCWVKHFWLLVYTLVSCVDYLLVAMPSRFCKILLFLLVGLARTLRFPWLKEVPGDGDTGLKEPPQVLVSAPGKSVRFFAANDLASAALAATTEWGRSPTGVTRTRTLLSHLKHRA